MLFPIFYGLIAPIKVSAKPLSAINSAIALATKLNAQLSIAIGALQITVPNLLSSATVEGLIGNENKHSKDSAAAMRDKIADLARNSGIPVHTETLIGDLSQIKSRFANRARVHGLVYAGHWLEIENDEEDSPAHLAVDIVGAVVGWNLAFFGRPDTIITITYSRHLASAPLDPDLNVSSPLIAVNHWEEVY